MKRYIEGNIERLVFEGLKARAANTQGGYAPVAVTLATVSNPKHNQSQANSILQGALGRVAALDAAVHKVAGDSRLTGKQRADLVSTERCEAARAVLNAFDLLAREKQAIDNARGKLFAVPSYGGDAAAAVYDQEIRARYNALRPNSPQRIAIDEDIKRGGAQDVLFALLRDPFGGPAKEFGRAMYDERVNKANAERVTELQETEEFLEHAAQSLSALDNVLKQSNTTEILGDSTPVQA